MAFTSQMLRAKAQGFVSALGKMTAKERDGVPNEVFMNDYNNLRQLVIETEPAWEKIMPPAVGYVEAGMGMMMPNCRYVEVQAYCEQILNMLGH